MAWLKTINSVQFKSEFVTQPNEKLVVRYGDS